MTAPLAPDPASHEAVWVAPGTTRRLSYRLWHPPVAPRQFMVILHGFGEHGGRYQPMAQELARRGVAVAVPDLWGHGRSGGARGDVERFAAYLTDLQALMDQVLLSPASRHTSWSLYGHSFGALVAVHWALRHPAGLERLVVQSPFFAVGFPLPAWKAIAAHWLGRLWPSVGLAMDLNAGLLSHDPGVVQAYRADPCVHNRMSARAYREIVAAGVQAVTRAAEVQVPTLLLYGEDDRIVSLEAARRWFERLSCEKRVVSFPHAYHELHHESVREEVLRLIQEWIAGGCDAG